MVLGGVGMIRKVGTLHGREGHRQHARLGRVAAVAVALWGCDVPLDLGDSLRCADASCSPADASPIDAVADVPPFDATPGMDAVLDASLQPDVLATPQDAPFTCRSPQVRCAGRCVALTTDGANCGVCGRACPAGEGCVAGACQPGVCDAPSPPRCGSELLAGWEVRPSCGATFVGRAFSSTVASTRLSTCTGAIDLRSPDSNAELPLPTVSGACPSSRPFTVTMVGRLPTNYQRGLGFALNWSTGEFITMNRWVWNSERESATDVLVSQSGGAFLEPRSRNVDTGGTSRPDRPWGWYIGNDSSWWTMTATVDAAAGTVTATFTQPSQSPLVYTATYAMRIPDGSLPSVKVLTAGPCDGSGLRSELLSLTTDAPLWR